MKQTESIGAHHHQTKMDLGLSLSLIVYLNVMLGNPFFLSLFLFFCSIIFLSLIPFSLSYTFPSPLDLFPSTLQSVLHASLKRRGRRESIRHHIKVFMYIKQKHNVYLYCILYMECCECVLFSIAKFNCFSSFIIAKVHQKQRILFIEVCQVC